METHWNITCPKCRVTLVVDRITGALLEVREPLVPQSSGDRFHDALDKVRHGREEAEEKFNQSREAEKNRSKTLEELFEKSFEQVKKEGPITRDPRNIDLD